LSLRYAFRDPHQAHLQHFGTLGGAQFGALGAIEVKRSPALPAVAFA
jgi:hypothetical protein